MKTKRPSLLCTRRMTWSQRPHSQMVVAAAVVAVVVLVAVVLVVLVQVVAAVAVVLVAAVSQRLRAGLQAF